MNETCEHCWSSHLLYIWQDEDMVEEYECEDCWETTFISLD